MCVVCILHLMNVLRIWIEEKLPKNWISRRMENLLLNLLLIPMVVSVKTEEYSPSAPISRDLLGHSQVAFVPDFNEPMFHQSQMGS